MNKKPIVFRNWSRGTLRTIQDSVSPGGFKLGLNFDSDRELATLTTRLGTDIVGVQAVDEATCYGLHYYHDTVGENHKLFGVFSDGDNNDTYDMTDGTKSLEDDTKNLKTRFCTYLGSCVRVNGTDAVKSYNGSAWVTSRGAFDEDNMPNGTTVIEWKDRVYTAGVSSSPNVLYYSSVADPDARTVDWTEDGTEAGAGNIPIEQEDGGGDITALEKVPGYLLVFKDRTMKRWDGNSTYPEDLISVGAPSQEAVCRGRGMVFIANQEGVWVTNGDYPKIISKPIQDLWDAISDYDNICTYCDEKYAYIYVGDISLGGNDYTNIMFRYNIDSQTWDVWSYANEFTVLTPYVTGGVRVMIGGDKDGQALQLNTGNTDYSDKAITYSLETQDIDFGRRGNAKVVNKLNVYTNNVSLGQLLYRANSDQDSEWKPLGAVSEGKITEPVENIQDFKVKGNWFNFKITGTTDSGRVKLLGFEFPEKSIITLENGK